MCFLDEIRPFNCRNFETDWDFPNQELEFDSDDSGINWAAAIKNLAV